VYNGPTVPHGAGALPAALGGALSYCIVPPTERDIVPSRQLNNPGRLSTDQLADQRERNEARRPRTVRREREPDSPRRYDYWGRPVTGIVSASERKTHSQVWSKHGLRARTTLRFDERDRLISRVRNPNLPTWKVHASGAAIRI